MAQRVVIDVDDVAHAVPRRLVVALGPCPQDGVPLIGGPAESVGREADVHPAVVAGSVLAGASRLPVGELVATLGVPRSLTVIDERGHEVSYSTDARIQVTENISYLPAAGP